MLSFQISLGSQGILETWVTLDELYGAFVLSFQSQKCFVDGTMKLHLTLHQHEVEEMMTEFTFFGGELLLYEDDVTGTLSHSESFEYIALQTDCKTATGFCRRT